MSKPCPEGMTAPGYPGNACIIRLESPGFDWIKECFDKGTAEQGDVASMQWPSATEERSFELELSYPESGMQALVSFVNARGECDNQLLVDFNRQTVEGFDAPWYYPRLASHREISDLMAATINFCEHIWQSGYE